MGNTLAFCHVRLYAARMDESGFTYSVGAAVLWHGRPMIVSDRRYTNGINWYRVLNPVHSNPYYNGVYDMGGWKREGTLAPCPYCAADEDCAYHVGTTS